MRLAFRSMSMAFCLCLASRQRVFDFQSAVCALSASCLLLAASFCFLRSAWCAARLLSSSPLSCSRSRCCSSFLRLVISALRCFWCALCCSCFWRSSFCCSCDRSCSFSCWITAAYRLLGSARSASELPCDLLCFEFEGFENTFWMSPLLSITFEFLYYNQQSPSPRPSLTPTTKRPPSPPNNAHTSANNQAIKQNGCHYQIISMQSSVSAKIKEDFLAKSSLIKENMTLHLNRKYTGSALTQNFFADKLEEDYISGHSSTMEVRRSSKMEEGSPARKEEGKGRPLRRSRKKFTESTLEPMKQKESVEIFTRVVAGKEYAEKPKEQQFEEFPVSTYQREQEKESLAMSDMAKRMNRRRNLRARTETTKTEESPTAKPTPSRQTVLDLEKPTESLFFDEEVQKPKIEDKPQQKQVHNEVQNSQLIPRRRLSRNAKAKTEQSSPSPRPTQPAESPRKNTEESKPSSIDEKQIQQELFMLVPEGSTLRMEVLRNKEGLNTFWPEFHLRFTNQRHLMSAKKTSSCPASTFLLSRNKHAFEENNEYYLGKVKSTASCDYYNFFGPGLNPSNAKAAGVVPRELLATLVFTANIFEQGGPRRFALYMVREGVSYYRDLWKVSKEEEVPLNQLYSHGSNKDKIIVLRNRRPKWSQEAGGYQLNFRGMAVYPSVKNFILEEEDSHKEVILFAKKSPTTFNLEVSTGISPFVAFCLAIASFDNRFVFQ